MSDAPFDRDPQQAAHRDAPGRASAPERELERPATLGADTPPADTHPASTHSASAHSAGAHSASAHCVVAECAAAQPAPGHVAAQAGPPGGQHEAPRFEETWAVEAAAAVLYRRWKAPILWALGAGPRRYNALASTLRAVTPKVLTEQLRELERDGLIARRARPVGAKHVEYALTPLGAGLLPALAALDAWGRARAEAHALAAPRQSRPPPATR